MIKETTENLYRFIVSQLPKKYGIRHKRTCLDDNGIPYCTALIIRKGPNHYLTIYYIHSTEDFEISIRKPQGTINKTLIHKYA